MVSISSGRFIEVQLHIHYKRFFSFFIFESLIAVQSKASQWNEMFCHDPEVMSSNPTQDKLEGA